MDCVKKGVIVWDAAEAETDITNMAMVAGAMEAEVLTYSTHYS